MSTAQGLGQQRQQKPIETEGLHGGQQRHECVKPPAMGNHVTQQQPLEMLRNPPPQPGLGDGRPTALQHRAVLDAGRTHALAGATAQTERKLIRDARTELDLPLRDPPHQVDTATR
jgi:hypothetical protein